MSWKYYLLGLLIFLSGTLQAASTQKLSPQKQYVKRAQEQLDGLSARLVAAEARRSQLDPATSLNCQRQLRQIWKKERLARVRLERIRKASAQNWRKLRPAEDALLVGLQKSYQHMMNHYFK